MLECEVQLVGSKKIIEYFIRPSNTGVHITL